MKAAALKQTLLKQAVRFGLPFLLCAGAMPGATALHGLITTEAVSDGCPVPPSVTRFLPTDERAVAWFEVDGVKGDVASLQWVDPFNKVYRSSSWEPLSDSGDYCFSTTLPIDGQLPAKTPGKWTAKIFWNNTPIYVLSFYIGSNSVSLPPEGTGGPANDGPGDGRSRGKLSFTGLSITSFNASKVHVVARLQGATFGAASTVSVLVNDSPVTADVRPDSVTFDAALRDGSNALLFLGSDSDGNGILSDLTLWSGTRTLKVTVLDEKSVLAIGATVTLSLGDDRSIVSTGMTDKGVVIFTNVPDRTVFLQATSNGNRYASLAVTGSAGSAQYKLVAFAAPSSVDNNDFSKGFDGWNVGGAPVRLVSHAEDGGESFRLAKDGLSPRAAAYASRVNAASATGSSQDLELSTRGEGPQTISRTFQAKPGTHLVKVRFKFITSEVPGGYFGSKYNDYFSVALRSQSGAALSTASNSMNAMGLSAFTKDGETIWRELTLPALGSNTLVDGTLTVSGDADDQLTDVKLEVLDGSAVIATSDLQTSALPFLNRPFGSAQQLIVGPSLFKIPSDQFGPLSQDANHEFTLRVRAISAKGGDATSVYGKVKQLSRYMAENRYPSRDPGNCTGLPVDYRCGGDDWALPEVRRFIEQYENVAWNDFSNMNGGPFPPHSSHDLGVDVDGWFDGYDNRNASVATKLIEMVNRGKERSVRVVYVKFTPEFQNAITNVKLADGRPATQVFHNDAGHGGHFHFRLSEHPVMGVAVTLHIQNKLLYPAKITVDGQAIGNVPAQTTSDLPYLAGRQLILSFDVVQPLLGSRALGDAMSGVFSAISNPSGTLNFKIDNHIGDSWFFVPSIDNHTDTPLLLSINEGLQSQNRCNCTIPANSSSVAAGYYKLFSNSNVILYRSGTNYTGKSILFGTDRLTGKGSFGNSVQAESGLLPLTVITPP
jgi:hypothetical protein